MCGPSPPPLERRCHHPTPARRPEPLKHNRSRTYRATRLIRIDVRRLRPFPASRRSAATRAMSLPNFAIQTQGRRWRAAKAAPPRGAAQPPTSASYGQRARRARRRRFRDGVERRPSLSDHLPQRRGSAGHVVSRTRPTSRRRSRNGRHPSPVDRLWSPHTTSSSSPRMSPPGVGGGAGAEPVSCPSPPVAAVTRVPSLG